MLITETNFTGIGTPKRGKVRDVYYLDGYLLIVATDRISAFDVVMNEGVPHKGEVLNGLSVLWLKKLAHIIPNHFLTDNVAKYLPVCQPYAQELAGRSMLATETRPLPVECVVRGYLSGSAWSDYRKGEPTCGITLPAGLVESQKLPGPIFTPTTKAETGHDQPITFMRMIDLIGYDLTAKIRDASILLYLEGAKLAEQAGIIIADTKFEFGLGDNGRVLLIDEVLTPDSSRFWPADGYRAGGPQPSFDKQFLRDYLMSTGWNKEPPPPPLPPKIIVRTTDKYLQAYRRLKGVLAG